MKLLDPVREWDHVRGKEGAIYTLVEYGDYECPACGSLSTLLEELQKKNSANWRLVYRHYPMSGIHKHAQLAAEAAEAASAQGQFWQMHDLLFANQSSLERKHLIEFAEELELDIDRFTRELKVETYRDRVRQSFIAGVQNGVNGTPSLFLNEVRQQGVFDERAVKEMLGLSRA